MIKHDISESWGGGGVVSHVKNKTEKHTVSKRKLRELFPLHHSFPVLPPDCTAAS